jgi:hypothetical protein
VREGYKGSESDVGYPRLDRAKCEVVSLVRSADILSIIDHPSELYRGEVRGNWKAEGRSYAILVSGSAGN